MLKNTLFAMIMISAGAASANDTIHIHDMDATSLYIAIQSALKNAKAQVFEIVAVQDITCSIDPQGAQGTECTLINADNQTVNLPAQDSSVLAATLAGLEVQTMGYVRRSTPILTAVEDASGIVTISVAALQCEQSPMSALMHECRLLRSNQE